MPSQAEKAEAFRALHHGDHPLVLPNAWDVPSARVFEDAGFPAVATSSAGLMVSRGYTDGEEMPRRELVATIGRIAAALQIPLSADIVAGYGRGVSGTVATVKLVLSAGAIGINLEDKAPAGDRLLRSSLQVRKIQAIRQLGESLGVRIVINARTDALRVGAKNPEEGMREAIRRAVAYRDAGADCVYPMGLTDGESIAKFVEELRCPINVMIRKGLPSIAELERLGVKRVSFGPSASYATMGLLKRASQELLSQGTFNSLVDGAITFDELNALAVPKAASPQPPP
jgi:2-methylisocitrate lyase-like PEP mutase family enzyme